MAKWYGVIGFAETVEVEPGIWEERIIEREYYGELLGNSRRIQATSSVNDDVLISNEISVLMDPYAVSHFHAMRYASFGDAEWKVTNIEVQYSRLLLTLGGVWNGN